MTLSSWHAHTHTDTKWPLLQTYAIAVNSSAGGGNNVKMCDTVSWQHQDNAANASVHYFTISFLLWSGHDVELITLPAGNVWGKKCVCMRETGRNKEVRDVCFYCMKSVWMCPWQRKETLCVLCVCMPLSVTLRFWRFALAFSHYRVWNTSRLNLASRHEIPCTTTIITHT